jgi:hypothetical protein
MARGLEEVRGKHTEINRRHSQEHRESLPSGIRVEVGVGHALGEGAIEWTGDDGAVRVGEEDHTPERPEELTKRSQAFSERDREAGHRIAQRLGPQRVGAPAGGGQPAAEHGRCSEAQGFGAVPRGRPGRWPGADSGSCRGRTRRRPGLASTAPQGRPRHREAIQEHPARRRHGGRSGRARQGDG